MTDLKQLIQIAPLPEDLRAEISAKADSLSPTQKYEIERLCWDLIAETNQNQIDQNTSQLVEDIEKGKRKYNEADFDQIEQSLVNNLDQKLSTVTNSEKINDIREQLQTQTSSNPQENPPKVN